MIMVMMMIMIIITITTTTTIITTNDNNKAEILNCTNQQQEPTALRVSLASPSLSFKSVPSRNRHGRPHFLTIGYC